MVEVAGGQAVSGERKEGGGGRVVCLVGTGDGARRGCRGAGTRWAAVRGGRVGAGRAPPGGGGRAAIPGAGVEGGEVGRLRGRSRRPRAAIITEPPFSGWLRLEEPRAVGAHPELPAGRPLCERPRGAAGRGVPLLPGGRFSRRSLLETIHASILN